MERNGFTLIELLGSLALLGLVLTLGIIASKDTLATTMTQFSKINENEIYEAARIYAVDGNVNFNDMNYTCVLVDDIVKMGYLKNLEDDNIRKKIVRLERDQNTFTIKKIFFSDECILK